MTPDLFRQLVSEAALAPSVHNVQPALWRLEGDAVLLIEDTTRRLPAGDPTGHDAAISLGAAAEGMCLAAAGVGLEVAVARDHPDAVARLTFSDGAAPDPLAKQVPTRQSWRGAFAAPTADDREIAEALNGEDCAVLTKPDVLATIAGLNDRASFGFLKDAGFRTELLSWMRLSPRHARWAVDGLNAEAMRLGRFERFGAGVVLGAAFPLLRALGLAAPLLAEKAKTKGAAGILVLHRPLEEDPFDSGRAFYRAWLRVEAAGFGAAVMAALADDEAASVDLRALANIPDNRRIVSAFRMGRRPPHALFPRARRPVDALIV